MKKYIKIIGINSLVLFALLLMVEVFFGAWFFSSNNLNNLGILKDVDLKYEQYLYEDDSPLVTYTRDKYGLRGVNTFNEPSKIDILTVGGSTTDQRYITDTKTWQAFLENKLNHANKNYLISNAGVDGQSTFGHIKSLELWFPEIENLKPKYVLFFIGINDIFLTNENPIHDELDLNKMSLKNNIKNKSALFNLFRKIEGIIKAGKANVGHQKEDFSKYEFTELAIGNSELFTSYKENNVVRFKKRIQLLIEHCNKINATPIFITQPTTNYKIVGDKILGIDNISTLNGIHKYNGVDYYNLLNLLNTAIHEVSKDQYQIIDLTNKPIWKQDDFYDFYHMTPKGTEKMAHEIFNQLKDKLK